MIIKAELTAKRAKLQRELFELDHPTGVVSQKRCVEPYRAAIEQEIADVDLEIALLEASAINSEADPSQKRPRLEIDKAGQRFRIHDAWYSLPGDRRVELMEVLMDAPTGEWVSGKAIHGLNGRPRRTLERLPEPVREIIETRRGAGGYRIKPEYRT
jgi:hypothetical protein